MRTNTILEKTSIIRKDSCFDVRIFVGHTNRSKDMKIVGIDSLDWHDITEEGDRRKSYALTLEEIEKQIQKEEDEYIELYVWRDELSSGRIYHYNSAFGWSVYAITCGQVG